MKNLETLKPVFWQHFFCQSAPGSCGYSVFQQCIDLYIYRQIGFWHQYMLQWILPTSNTHFFCLLLLMCYWWVFLMLTCKLFMEMLLLAMFMLKMWHQKKLIRQKFAMSELIWKKCFHFLFCVFTLFRKSHKPPQTSVQIFSFPNLRVFWCFHIQLFGYVKLQIKQSWWTKTQRLRQTEPVFEIWPFGCRFTCSDWWW